MGPDLDEVRALVFRLGFEAIVGESRGTVASVTSVVSDEPMEVQAAWAKMIDRQITLQECPSDQSSRPAGS